MSKTTKQIIGEAKSASATASSDNVNDCQIVSADWKDFEGFVDDLKEVLGKMGVYVYEPPCGGDDITIVLSKQPFTEERIATCLDAYDLPIDDEDQDDDASQPGRRPRGR